MTSIHQVMAKPWARFLFGPYLRVADLMTLRQVARWWHAEMPAWIRALPAVRHVRLNGVAWTLQMRRLLGMTYAYYSTRPLLLPGTDRLQVQCTLQKFFQATHDVGYRDLVLTEDVDAPVALPDVAASFLQAAHDYVGPRPLWDALQHLTLKILNARCPPLAPLVAVLPALRALRLVFQALQDQPEIYNEALAVWREIQRSASPIAQFTWSAEYDEGFVADAALGSYRRRGRRWLGSVLRALLDGPAGHTLDRLQRLHIEADCDDDLVVATTLLPVPATESSGPQPQLAQLRVNAPVGVRGDTGLNIILQQLLRRVEGRTLQHVSFLGLGTPEDAQNLRTLLDQVQRGRLHLRQVQELSIDGVDIGAAEIETLVTALQPRFDPTALQHGLYHLQEAPAVRLLKLTDLEDGEGTLLRRLCEGVFQQRGPYVCALQDLNLDGWQLGKGYLPVWEELGRRLADGSLRHLTSLCLNNTFMGDAGLRALFAASVAAACSGRHTEVAALQELELGQCPGTSASSLLDVMRTFPLLRRLTVTAFDVGGRAHDAPTVESLGLLRGLAYTPRLTRLGMEGLIMSVEALDSVDWSVAARNIEVMSFAVLPTKKSFTALQRVLHTLSASTGPAPIQLTITVCMTHARHVATLKQHALALGTLRGELRQVAAQNLRAVRYQCVISNAEWTPRERRDRIEELRTAINTAGAKAGLESASTHLDNAVYMFF